MLHETIGHYRIEANIDQFPINPIEYSDIAYVMFHKRYDLGNCKNYRQGDYNSWYEVRKELEEEFKYVVPVYMYDHSGLAFSTTPFADPWDSGQVGFACVKDPNDYLDVDECIKAELKEYTNYCNGEVYRVDIFEEGDAHEHYDCQSGFNSLEEALQSGIETVNHWMNRELSQIKNVYSHLKF